MPYNAEIVKFSDYLVENYLESDALFPVELCASFEKDRVDIGQTHVSPFMLTSLRNFTRILCTLMCS